jgi:erythromycin esterase
MFTVEDIDESLDRLDPCGAKLVEPEHPARPHCVRRSPSTHSRRTRMKRHLIALAAITLPLACRDAATPVTDGSPHAQFRRWAATHAHALRLDPLDSSARDLAPLEALVRDSRLVGFGEPFHGGHEPLLLRNRIVKYLVSSEGFSAVALETGLARSKLLYDYVLGTTPASDSALRSAFSYGFGAYEENLELVKWLRAWNAGRVDSARVRIYGMDLTGQMASSAAPAVEAVLGYLDRVDPDAGARWRHEFATTLPRFTNQRFPLLPPAEQDAISGQVQDLVSVLRGHQGPYVKASSVDDFDWAVHQAMNALQDVSYLRLWPRGFRMSGISPDSLLATARRRAGELELLRSVREIGMVDNLAWIVEREASRGRVLVFAHNLHLSRAEVVADEPLLNGHRGAGTYLAARFGRGYRVVGSYYGNAVGMPGGARSLPPDTAGIDGVLGSPALPAYLIALHDPSMPAPLAAWLATAHATRTGSSGDQVVRVAPSLAYDALVYFATIGPVR